MRRASRIAVACAWIGAFGALPPPAGGIEAPRPHIVFLLADDLGWGDVGFHGGDVATPRIDALAASGVRLEALYAQSLCSPTRAALLTGRYPMRYGMQEDVVRAWAHDGLSLRERLLPTALREAGYATAMVGKWHLGHARREYLPTSRGFDHHYGPYTGWIDYFAHTHDGGLDWHRDGRPLREQGYSTFLLAEEAARFVRERDRRRPFFLYVAFNAVHAPYQVPEAYLAGRAGMPEPRRTYAGMVAALDEAVGRILDAIDRAGLRRETLVVFASDNGGAGPGRLSRSTPLRGGKKTLLEGGTRVVAAVAWEGRLAPGTVVREPLHMVDWFPTFVGLAGGSLEQPLALDGRDAWATLSAGAPSPHDVLLLHAAPTRGAIRMGEWKLLLGRFDPGSDGVARPGGTAPAASLDRVELYRPGDDPSERRDLAAEFPEKVRELRARYEALAREAVAPRFDPAPPTEPPALWGPPP
jgi:arylsulfatase A-like enzyme